MYTMPLLQDLMVYADRVLMSVALLLMSMMTIKNMITFSVILLLYLYNTAIINEIVCM